MEGAGERLEPTLREGVPHLQQAPPSPRRRVPCGQQSGEGRGQERGWRAGGAVHSGHLGELVYEVLLLQDLQLQEVNLSFVLALVQVV